MFASDLAPVQTGNPFRPMRREDRGGQHPVKVYYTGAPPLAEQLAGQVRSGSGMTYGIRTPDGGKMPPGFTSWQFPREEKPVLITTIKSRPKLLSETMLDRFQAIEDAGGELPTRQLLYAEFGKTLLTQLRFMERTGQIKLWIADPGANDRGIALRIRGSDTTLRTPDAPLQIEL